MSRKQWNHGRHVGIMQGVIIGLAAAVVGYFVINMINKRNQHPQLT